MLAGATAVSFADSSSSLSAYLTILGSSSFCYVGIVELLVPEFCRVKKFRPLNVMSCIIGFGVMAGLALVQ